MDLRVWQWRSPWEKRTYLLYSLFYLCLLLREHATTAEEGYRRQESKNEVQDSNKLDSLSNYLPYYSKEDSDYKRGSAFFPLRGKKPSSDDLIAPHQLFMSDEMEDKRSQFFPLRGKKVPDDLKRGSYFMPMRGRKDDGWIDEDYDINDESANKRASSFMPMRGKKKYAAISDYLTKAGTYSNDVSEVLNPSSSNSYPTAVKRMHSFVPVRGKRSYKESESPNMRVSLTNKSHDDPVSDHSTKKRSVAFMPMRGRRELENSNESMPRGIATSLLEKKKDSFMTTEEHKESDYSDDMHDFDKRAKFMPMRGRRFSNERDLEEFRTELASKRAQSFMPMRGRRTQLRDIVFEGSNIPEIESRLIEDKRASSFMPMRGRKSDSEETKDFESDIDKKASAFTLMRGRRSISDLDNGDISKDLPDVQKRVSFMPMRGRRLVNEDFEVEPWPADQLMSLLNKKSSAFMPMRGRRTVGENFTVDPWPAEQLMSLFNKRSAFMPMRGRRENLDYPSQDSDELDLDYKEDGEKRSSYFMPMRGRRFDSRNVKFYNPYPYLMAGIGSSFMSKPFNDHGVPYDSLMSAANERRKKLRINWDAVKRAFHATRGKRFNEVDDFSRLLKDSYTSGAHARMEDTRDDPAAYDSSQQMRTKRSIIRPRVAMQSNRQYIALKRPMSFFATRGKRLDDSAIDKLSKLR